MLLLEARSNENLRRVVYIEETGNDPTGQVGPFSKAVFVVGAQGRERRSEPGAS
jgi:hypothetical protein